MRRKRHRKLPRRLHPDALVVTIPDRGAIIAADQRLIHANALRLAELIAERDIVEAQRIADEAKKKKP